MKTCHPCHYFRIKPEGVGEVSLSASLRLPELHQCLQLHDTVIRALRSAHPPSPPVHLSPWKQGNVCSSSMENSSKRDLTLLFLFKVTADRWLEHLAKNEVPPRALSISLNLHSNGPRRWQLLLSAFYR